MSETIQIPKEWSTARFGDIIELKHGHQFRTNDYVKSNGYKILKNNSNIFTNSDSST